MKQPAKGYFFRLLALMCAWVGTEAVNAQVIDAGTEQAHKDAAIGKDYSAAFFKIGGTPENDGTLTYVALPWTSDPWVIGPKHALDYTGQTVNADYEVVFGQSPINIPGETIGLSDFRLKGTGGLFSRDDVFLARLDYHPAGIDPIPLFLEDLSYGMTGAVTGSGDLYYGNGTFVNYDGDVMNGAYRIREMDSIHIQSRLFPPGHPQHFPFGMGGAPGMSGSPIEFMMSSGEVGMAAMANYVKGGFSYGQDLVGLRIDHLYPWIYSETIPDCPGDADGSRTVDLADFAVVQVTFGMQAEAMFSDGDFDNDDDVDIDDVTILTNEMGNTCPQP